MPKVESQAPHGPFLMPFGDFISKIIKADRLYGLTLVQFRMLLTLANSLDRHGYTVHLLNIKKYKFVTWAEMNGISRVHFSKELPSLVEKRIVEEVKVGQRKLLRLHPEFAAWLLGFYEPVEEIEDRLPASNLIGNEPVTKEVTNELPNRLLAGNLSSYIEDFSPKISLTPTSLEGFSSHPQGANPVENPVTRQISETFDLIHFDDPRQRIHVVNAVKGVKAEMRSVYQDFLDSRKGSSVMLEGFLGWMQAWTDYKNPQGSEIDQGQSYAQVFE